LKCFTVILCAFATFAAPALATEPWDYDRTVQLIVDEWRYAARDAVESAPPEVNWQEIALVELPWQVERTRPFAWFMTRITLPDSWAGQDVALHLEGVGPLLVLVDGTSVASIDGKGATRIKALLPHTLNGGDTFELAVGVSQSGGPSELNRVWLQGEPKGLSPALHEANTVLNGLKDYGEPVNPWKRMVSGPDDAAFTVDFDDRNWESAKVGDEWRGDDVVAWYRGQLTIPEKVQGMDTAKHGHLLALDFDDPADCYINGEKVSEIEKDYRGSIFAMPEGLNPGDDFQIAFRIRNRWGSGKLRQATWRLPEVDEGLALKRDLQVRINRLATTIRAHDRPQQDWSIALSALAAPLKDATKELSTLSEKIFAADKAYGALEESVSSDPVLLIQPYLQDVRRDEITICFETSAPIPASIDFGVNDLASTVQEKTSQETIHKMTLSDLRPDTTYTYRVTAGRQTTRNYHFTTAPKVDSPINFLVWGDNQSGYRMSERIARVMGATDADFVMSVGDVVDRGINWDEWTYQYLIPSRHFQSTKPSFIAMGNHEYGGYDGNPDVLAWEYYFKHPMTSLGSTKYWYSFDYGNAHFVILEPLRLQWMPHEDPALGNTIVPDDPQLVWLERDLKKNQGKHDWTFVFYHEPAFAETWSGGYYDGEDFIRNAVVPILETYDVDMVFNGHTHAYERGLPHPDTEAGNGITYIVTGGGGGGLDNHKYKEWGKIDLPDHPATTDNDEPDEGHYYRHHYCDVTIDGKTLAFKAQEVLPNGRLGDVMDSFRLKKD
jgi:hypothetical protein